jgi:hypothetical protein
MVLKQIIRFKSYIMESVGSFVTGSDGKPLVFHRGQPQKYKRTDLLDRYYTADKKYAETYGKDEDDDQDVLSVHIKAKKIFYGETNYITDYAFEDDREDLIAKGYDMLASKDKKVWLPLGITNDPAAECRDRIKIL